MIGSEFIGKSKTHRQTDKWVQVIRGTRDADIQTGIKLDIFRQGIRKTEIDCANPICSGLCADRAEKLHVTVETSHNRMRKRDGVDKLQMIAAPRRILGQIKLRHRPEVPTLWQLEGKGENEPTFDGMVPQAVLIGWDFDEW